MVADWAVTGKSALVLTKIKTICGGNQLFFRVGDEGIGPRESGDKTIRGNTLIGAVLHKIKGKLPAETERAVAAATFINLS